MSSRIPSPVARGWNCSRDDYTCADGTNFTVRRKIAAVRDLDEKKFVTNNRVRYARDARTRTLTPKLEISLVELDRGMKMIFGTSDGVRTITFPNTVKIVRQSSFSRAEMLRSATLNEGLEALGTDECKPDGKLYSGVFQKSGLRRVRLPSTLRRIECGAFADCASLKSVSLPEALEYLGRYCFQGSALEEVTFPRNLKKIEKNACLACANLKSVNFPADLGSIGPFAFYRTGLTHIELPGSLRTISQGAFARCEGLSVALF